MWYLLITKKCVKEVDKVLFSCAVPILDQKDFEMENEDMWFP